VRWCGAAPKRSRPGIYASSRGLGEPALEALICNTAWHGCFAVPVLFQTGPEATFSRLCPFEGRSYPEPGARAARGFSLLYKESVL
jgi:hypothetical protein